MKQPHQIFNLHKILLTIFILIPISYYDYSYYTNAFTLYPQRVTQLQQRCKLFDTNHHIPNKRYVCYNQMGDNDDNNNNNINTQFIRNTSQKELNVFLFTFPNLYHNNNNNNNNTFTTTTNHHQHDYYYNNHVIKLLKQWKYYILGDGGVYFDQRPMTLITLNQYLVEYIIKNISVSSIDNNGHNEIVIDSIECAVISTCKRFEILITFESRNNNNNNNNNENEKNMAYIKYEIKSIIASFLKKQIQSKRKRLKILSYLPFTAIPWDKPSRLQFVPLNPEGSNHENRWQSFQKWTHYDDTLKSNIENEIVIINGTSQVAERLILLASGLLDRPTFRPFSSRDAHIMSQIKGTSKASQRYNLPNDDDKQFIQNHMTRSKNTKYTKVLFDCALQGGKASRSPKVVPILDQLRNESIGADGPLDLSIKAAESAKILAVRPTLLSCLERIKAMEASEKIKNLHDSVLSVAMKNGIDVDIDKEWRRQISTILHKPTVDLRFGRDVDVEQVIMNIEKRILLDNNNMSL